MKNREEIDKSLTGRHRILNIENKKLYKIILSERFFQILKNESMFPHLLGREGKIYLTPYSVENICQDYKFVTELSGKKSEVILLKECRRVPEQPRSLMVLETKQGDERKEK